MPVRSPSPRGSTCFVRSVTPYSMRISAWWCIAILSQATCSSPLTARSSCSISAWPNCSTSTAPARPSRRTGCRHSRRRMPRRSRPTANSRQRQRTSMHWVRSSARCSPANRHSTSRAAMDSRGSGKSAAAPRASPVRSQVHRRTRQPAAVVLTARGNCRQRSLANSTRSCCRRCNASRASDTPVRSPSARTCTDSSGEIACWRAKAPSAIACGRSRDGIGRWCSAPRWRCSPRLA